MEKKTNSSIFFLLSGTTNKSINVSLWMVNCLGRDWHRKQYSLFIFSSVPTAFFIDFSWFRFLRRCSFIVSSEWQKLSTVISCNYFSIKRKLCDIKFTPVSSSAGNRISAKMMREAICRLPLAGMYKIVEHCNCATAFHVAAVGEEKNAWEMWSSRSMVWLRRCLRSFSWTITDWRCKEIRYKIDLF